MVGLLSWGKEESLPLKGGGISITCAFATVTWVHDLSFQVDFVMMYSLFVF